MTSPNEPEGRLVARARSGDGRAFARLLERHREGLFAFLARSTGDDDEAEDLLQMTAIRAWEGLASYEDRGKLGAWLFTIARRALIDHERREARTPNRVPGPEVHTVDVATDPHAQVVARDLEAAIVEEAARDPTLGVPAAPPLTVDVP